MMTNYQPRILILSKQFHNHNDPDSKDWRKFANCLDYRGYSVLSTSSASRALTLLKEESFEAVFLDYTMITRGGVLILEAYHDWMHIHHPNNRMNMNILIIGITDTPLQDLYSPISSPRDRNSGNMLMDYIHASTMRKSLAMLDLVVGNPMDNVNMIMELLDQKQNALSLPCLLDELDRDPRYQRFRPSTHFNTNKYEEPVEHMILNLSMDDHVISSHKPAPVLIANVPSLCLSNLTESSKRSNKAKAACMNSHHSDDDKDDIKDDDYNKIVHARTSKKKIASKALFKMSPVRQRQQRAQSLPTSSRSPTSITSALVTAAMLSPRWIEDLIREAFSPRIDMKRHGLSRNISSSRKVSPTKSSR